ncbi:hypothetical protein CSQ95_03840 [Janthinobacterium sp. BJB304]|nr:hypothetical protein CSQ95_03840 [Janthinobacterium sp. BJB304]
MCIDVHQLAPSRVHPFVFDNASNVSRLRIAAVRTQIVATDHWHFLNEFMPAAIGIAQYARDYARKGVVNVAFDLYGYFSGISV